MDDNYINITKENIDDIGLCCIIRKKDNQGLALKRAFIKDRLEHGHIYRKLDINKTAFIEYAPLEEAFVPILGDNFYYLYCLWIDSTIKGKGYGSKLLDYAIDDAKKNHKNGICMLSSLKQKNWLSNKEFAIKQGFKVVDETPSGYLLLSLSFNDINPRFSDSAKKGVIETEGLVIYYSFQCPFIYQKVNDIKEYAMGNDIPIELIEINNIEDSKNIPCPFNNFALFYNGVFQTVNILDVGSIYKLINK